MCFFLLSGEIFKLKGSKRNSPCDNHSDIFFALGYIEIHELININKSAQSADGHTIAFV